MPVNSFENYPMSWKPQINKNCRSLYRHLAEQLENDIRNGTIKPGTKLPPQRELADFLDINVSTVSKAFRLCELKGLLSATVGSGTFVAYDALTCGRLIEESMNHKQIDMGATVPEPSGNAILLELLKKMIQEGDASRLFSYNAPGTDQWQRETAVQLLDYCGHRADPEQTFLAHGGQNALSALLSSLFQRGDKIAVDDHTYPGIKSGAAMFGLQLVPIAQDAEGMDGDSLETACKNENIAGVYVIPACHNPTTLSMGERRRKKIAAIVEKYQCLLIEDGTYQLLEKGKPSIGSRIPEKSIYFASLSKAIAPGLRMACLSVPMAYKKAVSNALYSLNIAVVPMMAELSARVIASGQLESIMESHKLHTAKRNAIVDRYFPHDICMGNHTDIFRWLLLPEKYTGAAFTQLAYSHGVQVFPAEKFVVGKTPPAKAVRLSICAPETLEELEKGIGILKKLLNSE